MSRFILLTILLICFFVAQGLWLKKLVPPLIQVSMQNRVLNINQGILKVFNLGQKRMIVAFLWIKSLLDSDIEHYKQKDLNSWMYLRFNAITDLDPWFLQSYQFGSQYLSIVKDDDLGAKVIIEKGLAHYPLDYHLLLIASYHYHIELQDFEKAIPIFKKLIDTFKVPPHFYSIYASLVLHSGNKDLAIETLKQLIVGLSNDDPLKKYYEKKLTRLIEEMN